MTQQRVRVPAVSHRWAAPKHTAIGGGRSPARAEAQPAPYQTTGTGPRSLSFRPAATRPDVSIAGIATLRRQSRQLVRTGGIAQTIVMQLAKHIVGTGIVPELSNEAAQSEWEAWTDYSDADGVNDLYGQTHLAVLEMVEAGGCFLRRRDRRPEDGFRVPLQLQLIPVEQLDENKNLPLSGGFVTRDGIQYNAIEQRTGYWFFKQHPSEIGYDGGHSVLVPASEVIHLFHRKRGGQNHGVPWLAPIVGAIKDMEDFQDSTRLREANNANFNMFVKRNMPSEMEFDELRKFYDEVDARDRASPVPRVGIDQAAVWFLEPGEEVLFPNPPGVSNTYEVYVRDQKRTMATAMYLLYEHVSGAFADGNDRTYRAAHNDFVRGIEVLQHHVVIHQMLRRVMQWWGASARLAGVIGRDVVTDQVPWTPQAWPYLNPMQDVGAERARVRAGFTSRKRVLRGRGERVEEIDAENEADRQREKDKGLVYDTDPSRVSGSGVTQARPPDSELPDA